MSQIYAVVLAEEVRVFYPGGKTSIVQWGTMKNTEVLADRLQYRR